MEQEMRKVEEKMEKVEVAEADGVELLQEDNRRAVHAITAATPNIPIQPVVTIPAMPVRLQSLISKIKLVFFRLIGGNRQTGQNHPCMS